MCPARDQSVDSLFGIVRLREGRAGFRGHPVAKTDCLRDRIICRCYQIRLGSGGIAIRACPQVFHDRAGHPRMSLSFRRAIRGSVMKRAMPRGMSSLRLHPISTISRGRERNSYHSVMIMMITLNEEKKKIVRQFVITSSQRLKTFADLSFPHNSLS